MAEVYDAIIIGGGPAGLTAAIYGERAGLKCLVLAGHAAGGQLLLTTDVDDYPGFPEGVKGPELMERWRKQAERFCKDIINEDATEVDFKKRPFIVKAGDKTYMGKTVIIATGASPKMLGIPSEGEYLGRGVSTCAVCDSFFHKDKDVVVVGGGDTAMREAIFLANICKTVAVIHRRDKLRAQKVLQSIAFGKSNMKWVWDSAVEEFYGDKLLKGVRVKNVKTGKITEIPVSGAFVAIGHAPNTSLFEGQIEMEKGHIILRNLPSVQTNVPGVFAAGDVHDYIYMQAITAGADGCKAALEAHRFLEEEKGGKGSH